jgi:two-component system sensor histidine kinase TctE
MELAVPAVQKRIDLSLEAEMDIVVRGQARMLHELVTNLVDNAIRYTPVDGAVVLRVQAGENGAVLEVQDSGPGIAAAERDKVFTPFYRAGATMEVNPSGTGLGLTIVRDIVAVHDAEIALDAGIDGAGLTVRVVFPALQP